MIEHKPQEPSNNYLYISGVSVVGLAIVGYLLYNKFKKPKQNLIHIPPPSNISQANTNIEPKRDIFEMYLKISIIYIYINSSVKSKTNSKITLQAIHSKSE